MPPSNQSPHSHLGWSSKYTRRRTNPTNPMDDFSPKPLSSSSAVAAAEAAASSILSDAPVPKNLFRNRSTNINNSIGNDGGSNSFSNGSNNSSSILSILRRKKAMLLQQQRREKIVSSKRYQTLFVIVLIFVAGVFLRRDDKNYKLRKDNHNMIDSGLQKDAKMDDRFSTSSLRNVQQIRTMTKNDKNVRRENYDPSSSAKTNDNRSSNPLDISAEKPISSSAVDAVKKSVSDGDKNHKHIIPPILIFTYHTNLLTTPHSELEDDEDVALSKNIQKIVDLHPGSSIRFLNDDDCLQSIRAALGPDTKLTTYFTNESKGMYKADICRGAALYETGGLYFDIDIEARMPLWDVIGPDTKFVTTLVHKDSKHHGGFFQAFIGVTPKHPMLKLYLENFVKYYEGEIKLNGPLGVILLRNAYDNVSKEERKNSELWQEIRYDPKLFPDVKEPIGTRRACKMLVVAPSKTFGDTKREQMVPFYSHATGSRMCGGKDTNKKG